MWLCHQGIGKSLAMWSQLFLLALFLHAACFLVLFFAYRGYPLDITIIMGKKINTQVIVLPLCKRTHALSSGTINVQQAAVSHKASSKKKDVQRQNSKKKEDAKQPVSKMQQENSKKRDAKKKDNPTHPASVAEKKIQSSVQRALQAVQTMQTKKSEKAEQPVPTGLSARKLESSNEEYDTVANIGRKEQALLLMHKHIQYEVEQHWRPPVGVAAGTICEMRVMIDCNGTINSINLEKSSGIRIFDMSARASLSSVQFPRSAYGKEIIIHFSL